MADYSKAEVDPLLQDLWKQAEEALAIAAAAEKKHAALEGENRILLEKIASYEKQGVKVATVTLDPKIVDETLQTLEDFAVIQPAGREKIAADLTANPNNALHLLSRVVQLSAGAPEQGSGIPKQASTGRATQDEDPDGWGIVIREGA